MVRPETDQLGGYRQLRRRRTSATRLQTSDPACKIAESSIGASAMAHFCATLRTWRPASAFRIRIFTGRCQDTARISRGHVAVPAGIGHGAEIDFDAVLAMQA